MATTQALKRRVRSVRNAGQITKALEVVAASRMRKIQSQVEKARIYGEVADSIMRRIAPSQEAKQNMFFKPSQSKNKLYIVISSDRGQAGAFNSNVFNLTQAAINQDRQAGLSPKVIVFGRKGTSHYSRISDIDLVGAYEDVADVPETEYFAPLLETLISGFSEGQFGSVDIIYTQFKTSLTQTAVQFNLLPISLPEGDASTETDHKVYEFEPDVESVLSQGLRLYFEAKIMQARIESAASENAMRMVAMGNANRNARDLIDSLTLELNSLRQAAITQEIAEITAGSEAITA